MFLLLKEDECTVPGEIKLPSQVFDVAFHPERNVVAVGQIDGPVTMWVESLDGHSKMFLADITSCSLDNVYADVLLFHISSVMFNA